MSSKIINVVLVCLFTLCVAGKANAGLIVGDLYADDAGVQWAYVGSFELAEGPKLKNDNEEIQDVVLYNGLDVAEMKFGELSQGEYAISTLLMSDILSSTSLLGVNHKAWYDIYEGGANGLLSIAALDEGLSEMNFGGDDTKYDSVGDMTAYVKDRSSTKTELENQLPFAVPENILHVNHVFKSVTTSVPEPSTVAIFALALVGLTARRFKNK
ncbi:PEP-CTERM sorting domain-containing protein [Colwellia sp. 1_MG-2023]|uniref:PEP-CTERM sorting domain-containing protein n=1 Tax=unclassified Colwellia TaxID=196834 RepID=UPI002090FFEB|nr:MULTISPECIES: PEP-CTERM sorting domain-containing protein [unclassified Colwellia]MDO6652311.1 PEP-CTERM sorting domain-containing protein [Colwellia sp. 3_MG-2023]MDO6666929.1 PEP-CTERM sorting domain-containing protein [Colwellia sp. 2_MG-2023]MDO6691334.1 PEP-CTERM sorting domain-containing protein [Colwellia sp. 1_MG-2023]